MKRPLVGICCLCLLAVTLLWATTTEILRPTADSDGGTTSLGCIGTNQASTSMPDAWDAAGLTTSSSFTVNGTTIRTNYRTRIFSPWASTSNTYSALTLNVNSASTGASGVGGITCIKYSIDSGATWTTIKCNGTGWAQVTSSASLSATQDLTKLRVGICVEGDGGGPPVGSDDITIYDIWTSGTISTPAPPAGTGSGAGQPHRGMVIVN